ncbi:MAG TPA: FAD-dependent oxidoreductase [Anaerolineales bacterium]
MYDVIVIGGGPAGVTAALRASELGASAALVERDHLGGTCTNDGCVPTRVLARAARLLRNAEQFSSYGLVGQAPELDLAKLLSSTQDIVYKIHEKKQLIHHLESSGVKLYLDSGEAKFVDAHTLQLADGSRLEAGKFIISVGGHARRLDFPGAEYALTHGDVWNLKSLPGSLVIVGGAATGSQVASVFNAFGSQVTLMEVGPRILGIEDEIVSRTVQEAFQNRGVQVVTGIKGVERIEKLDRGLAFYYKLGESVHAIQVWGGMFGDGLVASVIGDAHQQVVVRSQHLDIDRQVGLIVVAMLHRVHRAFGHCCLQPFDLGLRKFQIPHAGGYLLHRQAFVARLAAVGETAKRSPFIG